MTTMDMLERQVADLLRLLEDQQAKLDAITAALIKAGLMEAVD